MLRDESALLAAGPNPTAVYGISGGNAVDIACAIFAGSQTPPVAVWCSPSHTAWSRVFVPSAEESLATGGVWPGPKHVHVTTTASASSKTFNTIYRIGYDGTAVAPPMKVGDTITLKTQGVGGTFAGQIANLSIGGDSPDGTMEFVILKVVFAGTANDYLVRIDANGNQIIGQLSGTKMDVSAYYSEGTPNRRILVTEDNVVVVLGDKTIWQYQGDGTTQFIQTGAPNWELTLGWPDSLLISVFGPLPFNPSTFWINMMPRSTWDFKPYPQNPNQYFPVQWALSLGDNKGIQVTYPVSGHPSTYERITNIPTPPISLPKAVYSPGVVQDGGPTVGGAQSNETFGLIGRPSSNPDQLTALVLDEFHAGWSQGFPPYTFTIPQVELPMPGGEFPQGFSPIFSVEFPCAATVFSTLNGKISKQYGVSIPFITGQPSLDAAGLLHVPAACAYPSEDFPFIVEVDFSHDYFAQPNGTEVVVNAGTLAGSHSFQLCALAKKGFNSWMGLSCSQVATATVKRQPPIIQAVKVGTQGSTVLEITGQNLAAPDGGTVAVTLVNIGTLVLSDVQPQRIVANTPAPLAPGDYQIIVTVTASDRALSSAPFAFTVTPPPQPVITSIAPATGAAGPLAPGMYVKVVGTSFCGLSSNNYNRSTPPWPTTLSQCSVLVSGVPIPIDFASTSADGSSSISAQLPFDIADGANVTVQRFKGDGTLDAESAPFPVGVAATAPSLYSGFLMFFSGNTITSDNPIKPGDRIQVNGVGFGVSNPPSIAGTAPPNAAAIVAPVQAWLKVMMNGDWAYVELAVRSASYISPGYTALTLDVPADLSATAGAAFLVVKCGDATSDEYPTFFGTP